MVEATVRPYEPSWRDRLAMMMMGDSRVSPERRRVVEGLLGSSGLGNTGMNVADFTPAGLLFAGNEYARAREEGDNLGAALAMASMVPGAGPVAKEAAPAVKTAAKGIRAYHGSPHDFDRFSLDKIGTGEGAQAFGHGLYFAEAEPVAKGYRDKLTTDSLRLPDGSIFDPSELKHMNMRVQARKNLTDLDTTIEKGKVWLSKVEGRNPDLEEMLRSDIARLETLKAQGGVKQNKGSMYEVDIKADPEQFLDWDRPLKEQPEVVRNVFSSLGTPERLARVRGEDAYQALGQTLGSLDWPIDADAATRAVFRARAAAETSKVLREAGIPGVKYLDANSRGAGDGSRNYVVFDDSLIEILRKYGIVPGILGGGAAAGGVLGDPQANGGVY